MPDHTDLIRRTIAAETAGWTPAQRAALLHRLDRETTRAAVSRTHPSAGALAQAIEPTTVQTPALQAIDDALEWALSTRDARLAISVPPQEGKTTRIGVWGTLRALTQNPERRVVLSSYAEHLARGTARQVRNVIREHGHGARDPLTGATLVDKLGLALADDNASAGSWQLAGHRGGLYAVGVGGSLTGRPADCVSPHTVIISDRGHITAADAHRNPPSHLLAYDHDTGRAVWRRLEATRRISRRRMLTIRTEAGDVLTCTPDHRVHTSRGYVPARDIRPGETLLRVGDVAGMPRVPRALPEAQAGHPQGDLARVHAVLHADVHGESDGEAFSDSLLRMRRSDTPQQENHLQRRLPAGAEREGSGNEGMPRVWRDVPTEVVTGDVLLTGMRGHGAFETHDRQGQLAPQDGHVLREAVSVDASGSARARRAQVRRVRITRRSDGVLEERQTLTPVVAGDPSHRRGRDEQRAGEPDHDVLDVPRGAPQVRDVAVSVVEGTRGGEVDAYDFQVEGTRNFFADGVLVHNCLLIDDPLKGMAEADSVVERRKVIDWWESVAQTRLAPGAPVVIIMTRWHEKDLVGHVLEQDKKAGRSSWRVVNIPAVATPGVPDALGREPGEAMISARGRTPEDFARIRTDVGDRVWSALYLGQPTPAGGGLFAAEWFTRHRAPTIGGTTAARIVSVDPAETGKADEAGIIGLTVTADGRAWVTDDRSGRMQSDEWARAAVLLALETHAGEVLFEAFTTGPTYERVLEAAWRRIRDEARLLTAHGGDVAAAAIAYAAREDRPSDPLAALRHLDGVRVPDQTDAPFRIRPWRAKGDKVARAAGTRQAASTGRLRMVGTHPELEEQATRWLPGQDSPDRMDALVNGYERCMQLVGADAQIATPGMPAVATGGPGMGGAFWSSPIG